jgi:hypothetical protein
MSPEDERGVVGRRPAGAGETVPDEAVPPDPPVGPGVPTRGDSDVPREERPTLPGPADPLDEPPAPEA